MHDSSTMHTGAGEAAHALAAAFWAEGSLMQLLHGTWMHLGHRGCHIIVEPLQHRRDLSRNRASCQHLHAALGSQHSIAAGAKDMLVSEAVLPRPHGLQAMPFTGVASLTRATMQAGAPGIG